jgi:hypothetical protein
VGHFLNSVELLNLVQAVKAGRETSMKTKDLVFNNCGQRQQVEQVGKVFPDIGVSVLPQALVIKTINLSDLPGFVISSQNGNSVGESNFKRNQKSHCFHRIVPSVYIVSHEKIVGIRWLSSY